MAIKGLSVFGCADRTVVDGADSYSSYVLSAKMTEYSASISLTEGDPLYADDAVCERGESGFDSGELTIKTCDMGDVMAKKILKLKEKTITLDGEQLTELIYDNDTSGKNLGGGVIETHQEEGETYYKAIWFHNLTAQIPADAATTKGKSISWQVPEIKFTIDRGATVEDTENGKNRPWKTTCRCETLAQAKRWLAFKGGNDTAPNGD